MDPTLTKREQRVSFHQIGHMLGLTHKWFAQGVTLTESQDPMVPDINVAEWFDSRSIMFYPTRAMRNHLDFWEMMKNHFDVDPPDYNYSPSETDLSLIGVMKYHLTWSLKWTFRDFIRTRMVLTLDVPDIVYAYDMLADFLFCPILGLLEIFNSD